jgi:hypothetical protein
MDQGWAVKSVPFTASASVAADPRAAALLGGQPSVRTATTPSGQTPAAGGQRTNQGRQSGQSSAPIDLSSGGIRTSVSQHDPMPLDPLGPGQSGIFYSPGRDGPDLVDSMGAPISSSGSTGGTSQALTGNGGIRQSVASDSGSGTYRTGSVSMVGGSGTQCPGPNCPATQSQMANQLNNMPPELVREITGYNIPGVGNTQPCTPSNNPNVAGGCNPQTGTSSAPGAPTTADQLRQRNQQLINSVGQNPTAPTGQVTPPCTQFGPNGQCTQVQGQTGFNGSVCQAWAGTQCTRYGQPNQQAGAAGQAGATGQLGVQQGGTQGATGQQNLAGQLTPQQITALQAMGAGTGAAGAAGAAATGGASGAFMPGMSTYYPAGVISPTGNTAGTTPATNAPGTSIQATAPLAGTSTGVAGTTTAGYSTAGAATGGGGVCLQFGPSGQCVSSR